jgi:hypothetical protein
MRPVNWNDTPQDYVSLPLQATKGMQPTSGHRRRLAAGK